MTSCPPHILSSSIAEKLYYYKHEVIVNHRTLAKTIDLIDHKANATLDRRLIFLVGGTGVGKTAALKKVIERRINRRTHEISVQPEISPAIYIEAEAPDVGEFAFKSLYLDALVALKTPLINRTLPIIERAANDRHIMSLQIERIRQVQAGEGPLKTRFLSSLVERETELVGIDEAVNVFSTGKPKSDRDRLDRIKLQANKLKTFTNTTPVALVLAGAYDFFEATLSSGQNARRSVIIHMEPYPQTEFGMIGFIEALVGLVSHLPIKHNLNITEISTEIFLQSLGCVGMAKQIFCEALLLACTGNEVLTLNHIRQGYYPAAQLKVMKSDLSFGINAIREATSLETLASPEKARVGHGLNEVNNLHKLKPGDTKPSHREEATQKW